MTIHEPQNLEAFKALLSSSPYVVVDFYADWCQPCKAIAPLFQTLSETAGALAFARVDVDKAQDIAAEYKVTAMPTFLFFEGGEPLKERDSVKGADPKALQEAVGLLAEKAKASGAGAAGAGPHGQAGDELRTEKETVSGGYHFTQDKQHRSDWRTTLT